MRTSWRSYVTDFHADRPGITERLLTRSHDDGGRTPYEWAAAAVPPGSVVLDLACGSAPMAARLSGARYLGLDLSAAELVLAAATGAPVVRADATALPLTDDAVDVVVMSMALMLVPWAQTLAEVARVLRPGGLLVALLPASGPLPARDAVRYARLCVALRQRLTYPNDDALSRPLPGFTVRSDHSVGFRCELDSEETARLLLHSLYVPGVSAERMAHGCAVVSRWVGTSITVPLRLLVGRVGG